MFNRFRSKILFYCNKIYCNKIHPNANYKFQISNPYYATIFHNSLVNILKNLSLSYGILDYSQSQTECIKFKPYFCIWAHVLMKHVVVNKCKPFTKAWLKHILPLRSYLLRHRETVHRLRLRCPPWCTSPRVANACRAFPSWLKHRFLSHTQLVNN